LEGSRDAADDGEGEVLDRPGGRLGDGRRETGGAVAREDDAPDAGALGAAEEGAEVAGVGDAGGDEEERRGAVLGRAGKVYEGDRIEGAGQRDDALGRVGAGLCIETGSGHGLDGDAALCGELLDAVELG
jgi:hypothetical protein